MRGASGDAGLATFTLQHQQMDILYTSTLSGKEEEEEEEKKDEGGEEEEGEDLP